MKKITIFDIADWFLGKEAMTHKKLQKLCYYAQAWFLVLANEEEILKNSNNLSTLFDERFQAWVHGPVCRELFDRYSCYRWETIPKKDAISFDNDIVEDVLNQVWDEYGELNANQLESLTHQEPPWNNARKDIPRGEACENYIDELDMFNYYTSQAG